MKGGFVTLRELVRIAWPLALAQLVSAVNCIWDRFQLARCGEIPLSASLSASMVAVMCVAMFAATAGYSSVFVSQFHGGGKSREAVKAFAQGVYLALASLPLLLLVTFAAGVAVDWVSTSEAIAASEKSYLRVFVPGGIFTVLNAVMSGFLSGQTRTRYAAVCNVVGIFVNIAVNPLLIHGWGPIPAMEIAGAATAAVFSGFVTCVLLAIGVSCNPLFREYRASGAFRFDRALLAAVLRKGSANGLNCFFACLSFTVFVMVLARLDALSSGASNTVFAVNNLFYCILCAISDGVCILCGRRKGADERSVINERQAVDTRPGVMQVVRCGLILETAFFIIFFAALLPFSNVVLSAFYPSGASFSLTDFQCVGFMLFLIMVLREFLEGALLVFEGSLRGIGEVRYIMLVKASCDFLFWLPAVLLVHRFNLPLSVLWLTMPANFFLICIFLYRRLKDEKRLTIATIN